MGSSPPVLRRPPYSRSAVGFPNASRLALRAVWLPSAFTLTDDEIAATGAAIRDFYRAS